MTQNSEMSLREMMEQRLRDERDPHKQRFLANGLALANAFDKALATQFANDPQSAQQEGMRAMCDAGLLERVDDKTMQFTVLFTDLSEEEVVRRAIAALLAGRQ